MDDSTTGAVPQMEDLTSGTVPQTEYLSTDTTPEANGPDGTEEPPKEDPEDGSMPETENPESGDDLQQEDLVDDNTPQAEESIPGIIPLTFIVKTIAGLEGVLAAEIAELGGANVQPLTRAVSFEGDKRMLYKANYCLRTAQRILMPIFTFQMADEDDLYNQIFAYPWENHLTLQKTLAVDAVSSDSELTHTHYIAQRTKDAIVDRFRTISNGRRPSVDTENPHVRINVHIRGSICNVSIDSSGASLHKRGYRVSNAEAPLSEVLAAGLILLSGWKRDCHFIDPMCGSGTLAIEAAMYANNFPAGMYRKEFGFMHWNDFDQDLWNEVTTEAQDKQTEFEYQIIGSDISTKNLASARANVKAARLHKDVQLSVNAFSELKPPAGEPGLIIINPPYGERIRLNDIVGLYKSIGNTLKQEFSGYQAWVISSDQRALSLIGLRPTAKLPVFNGPLECRFEHFDLYKGSKRGRYMDAENPGEEGRIDSRDYANREDKPNWRSKEAPEGDFDSLDPKPREFKTREFKPREEHGERRSSRFESKEGTDSRPPRRDKDSGESEYKSREFKPREYKPRDENSDRGFARRDRDESGSAEGRPARRDKDSGESEYKSREFKPREYKPRDENSDKGFVRRDRDENKNTEGWTPRRDNEAGKGEFKSREFIPREPKPRDESEGGSFKREKSGYDKDSRNGDRPARDGRFGKEERPERRKVVKQVQKPVTRIEERGEYPPIRKNMPEIGGEKSGNEKLTGSIDQSAENIQQRKPSKGNKFTELRDYKIAPARELRPRKPKAEESEHPKGKPQPKPRPASKPDPKSPGKPINYDELED